MSWCHHGSLLPPHVRTVLLLVEDEEKSKHIAPPNLSKMPKSGCLLYYSFILFFIFYFFWKNHRYRCVGGVILKYSSNIYCCYFYSCFSSFVIVDCVNSCSFCSFAFSFIRIQKHQLFESYQYYCSCHAHHRDSEWKQIL